MTTRISDSLYRNSKPVIFRLKVLMLSSSLFQQKRRYQKICSVCNKDRFHCCKSAISRLEARIAGFLSTQYRIMGLYEEEEEYLEKGKKMSSRSLTRKGGLFF